MLLIITYNLILLVIELIKTVERSNNFSSFSSSPCWLDQTFLAYIYKSYVHWQNADIHGVDWYDGLR